MRRRHKVILLGIVLVLALSIGCKSGKSIRDNHLGKEWYKGNLHTHSYWSDGDEFPEVILDWYKSKGYQFIALSDHNTLAEGEKWVEIAKAPIYQNAFKKYLKSYGKAWVNYKIDSGVTRVKLKTYEEYRGRSEKEGKFLILQSEEITDKYKNTPIHLNATNIENKIAPQGGNSIAEVLQNNITKVLEQREETGIPMVPHINHPNFGAGIDVKDMMALKGERFFEVYNGHHMVLNMGDSTHLSTEDMWDLINISYLENNKPIMFGLATDDSHNYHHMGSDWSNAGRGWISVQAASLSAADLIIAMEKGDFYASTGVTLKKIAFKDNMLSIEVLPENGITYKISFLGVKNGESQPTEFISTIGTKGSFELTKDILFARCKITSSKLQENPIENIVYEMAWTQPVVGTWR